MHSREPEAWAKTGAGRNTQHTYETPLAWRTAVTTHCAHLLLL